MRMHAILISRVVPRIGLRQLERILLSRTASADCPMCAHIVKKHVNTHVARG